MICVLQWWYSEFMIHRLVSNLGIWHLILWGKPLPYLIALFILWYLHIAALERCKPFIFIYMINFELLEGRWYFLSFSEFSIEHNLLQNSICIEWTTYDTSQSDIKYPFHCLIMLVYQLKLAVSLGIWAVTVTKLFYYNQGHLNFYCIFNKNFKKGINFLYHFIYSSSSFSHFIYEKTKKTKSHRETSYIQMYSLNIWHS